MENNVYDLIIIGGGPSGITSAIYAQRANLKVLLIESFSLGGQILNSSEIKNYPAFEEITGQELAGKMAEQVNALGVRVVNDEVIDVNFDHELKEVKTNFNGEFLAKTVILAMGAKPKKLGVIGEEKFLGLGVSYCAICDGNFFRDKIVAVVGGGNSATEDTNYLCKVCKKVYLILRNNQFKAEHVLVQGVLEQEKQGKLEILYNTEVHTIDGEQTVTNVSAYNNIAKKSKKIEVDGIFIAIGREPNTELVRGKIDVDNYGYIKCNEKMETSKSGVYAVGDVREKELRQIVTAMSDGAIASTEAVKYISLKERNV